MTTQVSDYALRLDVRTDHLSALLLKERLELIVAVTVAPTRENTSALFDLAAEAVVMQAQQERIDEERAA